MKAEEIEAGLARLQPSPDPQAKPSTSSLATAIAGVEIREPAPVLQLDEERQRKRRRLRARRLAELRKDLAPCIHARILAALTTTQTPCVLMLGPSGVGKTRAMHWLRAEFGGTIMRARKLGSCERRHGLGEGYAPEMRAVQTERVLYLDDIGTEDPRDLSVLQDAIDYRYENRMPTVASSGLTMEELKAHLGAPYLRRLVEQHARRRSGAEWPVVIVDLFAQTGGAL